MIEKLFDYLYESKITLIGFSCSNERNLDKILSKLPHIKLSNYGIKSDLRELKISYLLNDEPGYIPKFLVLDLIEFSIGKQSPLTYVRENIGKVFDDIKNTDFNLIVLSPMNAKLSNNNEYYNTSLTMTPLLTSDLSIIVDDKINIIKNRRGNNDSFLIDELKNYNYICNYEYNNK